MVNEENSSIVSSWQEDKDNCKVNSQAQPKAPKYYSCKDCDKNFNVYSDFKCHLLNHVQLPNVIVQRLNPSYVRRITSHKPLKSGHRGRKRNFARKRIRSYIIPKVNKKKSDHLKLTIKLASDTTAEEPSFEVVPRKILIGPGDHYPANGGVLDEVKTEVVTQSEDVEWNSRSVEVVGEKEGELAERTSESRFETSDNSGTDHLQSGGQDESGEGGREEEEEEEEEEDDEELTPDNFGRETNGERNDSIGLNAEQGFASACPSPTPSEQLKPDFLAPERDGELEGREEEEEEEQEDEENEVQQPCDNQTSPTMVEVGAALAEAGSPAFPTTSPAAPPSGDSNSQHSLPEQSQQAQSSPNPVLTQSENNGDNSRNHSNQGDDTSLPPEAGNFNWNDVGNVTSGNNDDPASNTSALEERDPLMIPDQPPSESGQENISAGNLNDAASSDSLLRGFLCDPSGSDKAITVTAPSSGVVGSALDGLGSEYISLERLGETGALSCCDVCGEQTSNLDEHRARAGHYKCGYSDCGNQIFPNLNDLATHQHVTHGGQPPPPPPPQALPQQPSMPPSSQQYPIPHHQPPPPVQQLAQQVQRLPIPPPQQLSPHQMNHHPQQPVVQQMSPQLHQLMPPQQQYPQSPVRRPPPLYRVPGSNNMPGAPAGMQYPNQPQQHMMYNQQSYPQPQNNYPGPAGPMTPPRPYGNMVQQMNRPRAPSQHSLQRPSVMQQQQQPRMAMSQKRPVVAGGSANSPNKQRRMDVLIPDRHDDADCHVIAMQKRTESGPVIGSVQGAANSGRPESMIHLTDSITLSVRQPQGGTNANQSAAVGGKNKSDAKAVANILATRGITVTPAGGTGGRAVTQQNSPQQQRQARPAPVTQPPPPVTTLNLNSAISIIAQPTASSSRQQQVIFSVIL